MVVVLVAYPLPYVCVSPPNVLSFLSDTPSDTPSDTASDTAPDPEEDADVGGIAERAEYVDVPAAVTGAEVRGTGWNPTLVPYLDVFVAVPSPATPVADTEDVAGAGMWGGSDASCAPPKAVRWTCNALVLPPGLVLVLGLGLGLAETFVNGNSCRAAESLRGKTSAIPRVRIPDA